MWRGPDSGRLEHAPEPANPASNLFFPEASIAQNQTLPVSPADVGLRKRRRPETSAGGLLGDRTVLESLREGGGQEHPRSVAEHLEAVAELGADRPDEGASPTLAELTHSP